MKDQNIRKAAFGKAHDVLILNMNREDRGQTNDQSSAGWEWI